MYDVPDGRPTHHFAWLQPADKTLEIVRVQRKVVEHQPATFPDGATTRIDGDAGSVIVYETPDAPDAVAEVSDLLVSA